MFAGLWIARHRCQAHDSPSSILCIRHILEIDPNHAVAKQTLPALLHEARSKGVDHRPGTTIQKLFSLCWAVFLDKLYGTGLDSSTKVKSGVWERSPHNGDTEGANGAHERAAKLSGKKDPHPQTSGIAHTVVGVVGCHVSGSFSYRGSVSKVSEISGFHSWFSLVSWFSRKKQLSRQTDISAKSELMR